MTRKNKGERLMYLNGAEEGIRELARAAYPGYKGRTLQWQVSTNVELQGTYWEGGSRSTYAGVNLSTRQSATLPHYDPPQFGGPTTTPVVPVQPGMAIVEHKIFLGKDLGLTFYVHPNDAPNLLPAPADTTDDEKIVLAFTGSLKNTYGGQKDIRFREANSQYKITQERWTEAQDTLKERKLLNKAGSITPDGRNVNTDPFRY
jgi:hypothetical protein